MASEIPRDADQLKYRDKNQHGQGGEQSNGTLACADRGKSKDQKYGNETELHPLEDLFRSIDRFVIVAEMPVGKTRQVQIPGRSVAQ